MNGAYMIDAKLKKITDGWHGSFSAMASPCEVLMEIEDESLARQILTVVSDEAKRIEQKFSRYRDDNVIFRINHAAGKAVQVDEETARLIDFGENLYQMSGGLFDITSGILRKAWRFDGSDNLPKRPTVKKLVKRVGWGKVSWEKASWKKGILTMKPEMEIDLGGIGKEYAVDRSIQLVQQLTDRSVLINFGGDLATNSENRRQSYWSVGQLVTGKEHAVAMFRLRRGAIATSGDAHRYLLKDGVRYSHVLNPKTGWSVPNTPHTVSVAALTCIEAGMMSTLAMLQGDKAGEFLKLQEVEHWID
jgi:thiamine biosynthesis lipoprotein